jgi:hypothetical protein
MERFGERSGRGEMGDMEIGREGGVESWEIEREGEVGTREIRDGVGQGEIRDQDVRESGEGRVVNDE